MVALRGSGKGLTYNVNHTRTYRSCTLAPARPGASGPEADVADSRDGPESPDEFLLLPT